MDVPRRCDPGPGCHIVIAGSAYATASALCDSDTICRYAARQLRDEEVVPPLEPIGSLGPGPRGLLDRQGMELQLGDNGAVIEGPPDPWAVAHWHGLALDLARGGRVVNGVTSPGEVTFRRRQEL